MDSGIDQFRTDEVVRSLVRKYSEYTAADLTGIISRYLKYEPEAVKAALYVSVEKGFITYDLRESLWKQIDTNYTCNLRKIKNFRWENSNAFIDFFASYNDDQLYDLIDNPESIILDVYHAVLATARNRELISDEDFRAIYGDAKSGSMNEDGTERSSFGEILRAGKDSEDFADDQFRELDRKRYWKCPKCSQLVEMNFSMCWNCQAEIPDVVEHPAAEEVIREKWTLKDASFARSGSYLFMAGIIMALYEYLKPFIFTYRKSHIFGYVFAGIFVLVGLVFVVYGLIFDSDGEKNS